MAAKAKDQFVLFIVGVLLLSTSSSYADETDKARTVITAYSSSSILPYADQADRKKQRCKRILSRLIIAGGFAATGWFGWSEFNKRGGKDFFDDNRNYYDGSPAERMAAIKLAENSPNPYRQGWAHDRKLKAALQAVNSKDPQAQVAGMKALFEIDQFAYTKYWIAPDKRLSLLIDRMKNESDLIMRMYAAEALGRLGDVSAIPELKDAMKKDSDKYVRTKAARALAILEGKEKPDPQEDDE